VLLFPTLRPAHAAPAEPVPSEALGAPKVAGKPRKPAGSS
jgi:hypothetical protein